MCNSQRQSTVFENSSENFIVICFPWIKIPIQTWLNILLFQNTANHFMKLQDCIQSAKIGKGIFDHGKISILQICGTAGFKIDWYIPKPETFCQLSGERRLCIITTYFIWETCPFFTVSFHSSLWSWRMIFESGHRGRAGFRGQAWLLTALYLERLSCWK